MFRPSTQIPRAAMIVAACALAACGTTGTVGSVADDPDATQATPANIASLSEVIQRNPERSASLQHARQRARTRRAQSGALADFNKAVAIDANYAQAFANRGQVHRQMKQLDAALADYNKAMAID